MKALPFSVSVQGSQVNSIAYLPDGQLRKLIVFLHGFPGTSRPEYLREPLCSQGVGIIEVAYRGDKDSEGKFSFLGSLEDIKSALDYLDQQFPDVEKHALGYSTGALYILNVVHHYQTSLRSLVLLNPVVDSHFLSDDPIMSTLWELAESRITLKTPEEYRDELTIAHEKFNPMNFVKEIQLPITVLQSQEDEVVPIPTVEEFFARVVNKRKFVWLPNEKHHLQGGGREVAKILLEA